MDFLVVEQIGAIAMVLFGAFILNTCSRWETDEKKIASDRHNLLAKKYQTRPNPHEGIS
jgi:PBP1b-binding outer membrane lipoprotein LpoB